MNTTLYRIDEAYSMLWIAFKNLIFDYWTQLGLNISNLSLCCELLSKILSLTIEHNHQDGHSKRYWVVNCFQKSYLWLLNTTSITKNSSYCPLWIAFKNLIFDYWTQLDNSRSLWVDSCELLSKILSLTIEHNDAPSVSRTLAVVNCFQKSYLWLLNTTTPMKMNRPRWLWIAFKNLIFDYWTQRRCFCTNNCQCCELLSKILSLTIEHNESKGGTFDGYVVNCFQKSYLWLLNTTLSWMRWSQPSLWIAFKNLIFDYWTQLRHIWHTTRICCELLSKILSLTIEHNFDYSSSY